jgi:hypothetical protein
MRNLRFITSLALILGLGSSLQAQIIFAENFDYDGTLSNGENIANAAAWTGGTNNVRYRDSSQAGQLSFTGTGYVPTHAGGYLWSGNSNSTDYRGVNAALGQTLDGEFWISAFVNPFNISGSYGATTMFALNTGSTSNCSPAGPGFGIYYDGSIANGGSESLNLAFFTGAGSGGVGATGPAITGNQWYLFVARVNIGVGNDQIDVWTFTADANIPTTVAGLGASTISSSSLDWGDSINTINVGGQRFAGEGISGGKDAYWDDIRVTNLSGDAGLEAVIVPEPATYAILLGVLALGAVLLRRRCR